MTGMIYTFYSFKGGVGRSMALANIGMHFYRQGYHVVMIDWDLEAPGLERYFQQRIGFEMTEIAAHVGLTDLIQVYKEKVEKPPTDEGDSPYPDLSPYLVRLLERGTSSLSLLPAGKRGDHNPNYAGFVQSFDWTDFYTHWGGGAFMDWLRGALKERADIVLIDSRTGYTEMGGIATQHMADVVVAFFAANYENMENSAQMVRNFMSEKTTQRRDGRPLPVIAVPSRIDIQDSAGFSGFHNRLNEMFLELTPSVLNDGYALPEMIIPYVSGFSYRELLVIDNSNPMDEALVKAGGSIAEAYLKIAANMIRFAPEDSVLRTFKTDIDRQMVFISYPLRFFEVADQIRIYLSEHGFEVERSFRPETWRQFTLEDDEREIARSVCMIMLVNNETANSRLVGQFLSITDELNKPVIPVIVERNARLPRPLSGLNYLEWDGSNGTLDVLTAAVRAFANTVNTGRNLQKQSDFRPKLYISYSHKDREIAQRIYEVVEASGFDVFIDFRSILPGEEWASTIEKIMEQADGLIVLLSPFSTQSKFVRREITFMDRLGKPIFPVVVQPLERGQMPLELTLVQYIDLTDHQNDGFEQLVRAIRTGLNRYNR